MHSEQARARLAFLRRWIVAGILLSVASLSAGCALNATMVPVEGPMSQLAPVPLLKVRATGIMGNSGNITTQMPDGAHCKGRWASAAGSGITVGSGSLLGQYGAIYGTGWSVSPGRGQNPGQALMTCEDGRVLEIEFVTGAGTAHGFGIGKDNRGHIFRFVF